MRQSLILDFIQDDYEGILYLVDKQLNCYYLFFVQLFKIAKRCHLYQNRHFQRHNNDNNTTSNITLLVDVSSTNGEEEIKKAPKLVPCNDSQDLANKNMEDMIILNNSFKDDMKDYLEGFLDTKVEVLKS